MSNIFAVIKASYALEIAPFESTETTRYYLNGFALSPVDEGIKLTATDGHVMLIAQDVSGYLENDTIEKPIIGLSKDFRATIKKMMTKYKSQKDNLYVIVEGSSGSSAATLALLETPTPDAAREILAKGAKAMEWLGAEGDVIIDGTFPDVHRVLPPLREETSLINAQSYNTMYLHKFGSLSPFEHKAIETFSPRDKGPSWVAVSGRPDVIGVIMPVHFHNVEHKPFRHLNPSLAAFVQKPSISVAAE